MLQGSQHIIERLVEGLNLRRWALQEISVRNTRVKLCDHPLNLINRSYSGWCQGGKWPRLKLREILAGGVNGYMPAVLGRVSGPGCSLWAAREGKPPAGPGACYFLSDLPKPWGSAALLF